MIDSFIHSFPPLVQPDANTLVLGSMPGKASLKAQQYYAHPRNAFWPIMAQLHGFDASLSYLHRVTSLTQSKVALWDVLKTCTRDSSLDSDIVESSIIPNAFEAFLSEHGAISRIFFNGAKAEAIYHRYVISALSPALQSIALTRLPSTSPAHASLNVAAKLAAWRCVMPGPGSC